MRQDIARGGIVEEDALQLTSVVTETQSHLLSPVTRSHTERLQIACLDRFILELHNCVILQWTNHERSLVLEDPSLKVGH